MKIRVGTKLRSSTTCLGNPVSSWAVCVDKYHLGDRAGYMMIFENGRYDGFSEQELDRFFDPKSRDLVPEISSYIFSNVIKLSRDYDRGKFDASFK